jgi:hypothetical protein
MGCIQFEENGARVDDICRFVTRVTDEGVVEVYAASKDRIHVTELKYAPKSSTRDDKKAPEQELRCTPFPSRTLFIPEEPLELQWFGPHLCVAFAGSITIVLVATGHVHELCDVLAGRPLATRIDDTRILVSDGTTGYLLLKVTQSWQFIVNVPFVGQGHRRLHSHAGITSSWPRLKIASR